MGDTPPRSFQTVSTASAVEDNLPCRIYCFSVLSLLILSIVGASSLLYYRLHQPSAFASEIAQDTEDELDEEVKRNRGGH